MKVILLKDVAKVGRRFEVKELADGYARNFIIARGLGMIADKKNLERLERLKSEAGVKLAVDKNLLEKQLAELSSTTIHLSAKTNEEGHLFASIHAEKISEQLRKEAGIQLSAEMLVLESPIKAVGKHQINVKTAQGLAGQFTLEVASES